MEMFVKLTKKRLRSAASDKGGNYDAKVIPYENLIYEADFVRYTKFPAPVSNGEPVHKTMKDRGVNIYSTPFGDPAELDEEYLLISIIKGDRDSKHLCLVASGCTLFLMNDKGKTVDTISCHSRHLSM